MTIWILPGQLVVELAKPEIELIATMRDGELSAAWVDSQTGVVLWWVGVGHG